MSERRMFITPDGTVRILEKKPGGGPSMSDRPSWLPSDEEILDAIHEDISEETGCDRMCDLIERAALKAQIEALSLERDDAVRLAQNARARLSELEGSHG